MADAPTPADVERFCNLIGEHLGLLMDEQKLKVLDEILRPRIAHTGKHSSDAYFRSLVAEPTAELRAVAELLSVPETYFFRGRDHFQALAEIALPDRMRANQS